MVALLPSDERQLAREKEFTRKLEKDLKLTRRENMTKKIEEIEKLGNIKVFAIDVADGGVCVGFRTVGDANKIITKIGELVDLLNQDHKAIATLNQVNGIISDDYQKLEKRVKELEEWSYEASVFAEGNAQTIHPTQPIGSTVDFSIGKQTKVIMKKLCKCGHTQDKHGNGILHGTCVGSSDCQCHEFQNIKEDYCSCKEPTICYDHLCCNALCHECGKPIKPLNAPKERDCDCNKYNTFEDGDGIERCENCRKPTRDWKKLKEKISQCLFYHIYKQDTDDATWEYADIVTDYIINLLKEEEPCQIKSMS